MTSIQSIEGALTGIIKPPPKKETDEYRYYQCQPYMAGIKCDRVDHQRYEIKDNSKLLFVKSYIPECFDKYILKYKWIPKWVSIENNEPKTK